MLEWIYKKKGRLSKKLEDNIKFGIWKMENTKKTM
jgi:hypothetical protein